MSTLKRKKKTMMTITLMIASTTLPDTLPMAENCIKYEDDKKMIRWWYNHHEDEKCIEVYESVENF